MTPATPVALIGCGNLGSRIARGIAAGDAGACTLTAVYNGARHAKAGRLAQETGAIACATLDELLATRPEYVVEAATGNVLREVAVPCLRAPASLIVLSTGAFADPALLDAAMASAREHRTKIHVASGALGGFDIAQAAAIGGDLHVAMTTEKPPRAFGAAPGAAPGDVDAEPRELFRGSAREAIARFPQNVNVAVALGLATTGLDRTTIAIRSNPRLTRNRHSVVLEGAFGAARIEIEARPSPDNPQSSLLAAYSVLALLAKIASPIQF